MLPWPIKAGGDQAVFNMINHLQHQCDIHYLYPAATDQINPQIHELWNKVTFHPFIKSKNFNFIKSRIALKIFNQFRLGDKKCGWLQSASNFFTPEFLSFVYKVIKDIKPDIVQTEFYNYQDLVYAIPDNVKKIFIQHEIRYVINSQRLSPDCSIAKRFAFNKLKGEEIAAMNSYDAVFTLTDMDKKELHDNGVTVPIYSSPAGIEQPEIRNGCIFSNKLIFVGGSVHTPNLEGITWFINEVWNNIIQKHPEVSLNIIGKWDEKSIKNISDRNRNIHFKGFVPNLQEEYNGAIAIVPILRGSGMRMKIIDAVNFGSPFVSTSIGAEGLEYKNSIDCFIADSPTEFAERVIELIENKDLREKFYKNSSETCNKYYSMKSLANNRMALYHKVLDKINP